MQRMSTHGRCHDLAEMGSNRGTTWKDGGRQLRAISRPSFLLFVLLKATEMSSKGHNCKYRISVLGRILRLDSSSLQVDEGDGRCSGRLRAVWAFDLTRRQSQAPVALDLALCEKGAVTESGCQSTACQ